MSKKDAERPSGRRIEGPPPRKPATGCLIVGWNRHPASGPALRYAVGLADLLTAHVHVVHIVDIDDAPLDTDASDWEEQMDETLDREAAAAQALLNGLEASWTYHTSYSGGPPGDLLATIADTYRAFMVVIGSPRGGLISFLEGLVGQSVSHRLIGRRNIPLLIVPADTHVSDPRTLLRPR